jgi:lysyl-tRNA synthetase class 1
MPDQLAARLRASLEGADDWYAIERAFTEQVADNEIDAARAAAYAFGYMLVGPGNDESRARNGVFAPRIEWEGGNAFPPRLDEVLAETRDEWLELYDMLDEHSARSRLGDLLWVTRHGEQPHVAARAAAASYIALLDDPNWSLMDRVDSAARALELTAELHDRALEQEAIDASMRFVRADLAQTADWRPGVPLRVLERLVELAPTLRPTELRDLVDKTGERYGADPFIAESVAELQLRLSDPSDRDGLRAGQVQRWRNAAEQATGLTRLAHLRRALELARATAQREVAEEVAIEIEQLSPEELELKTHTVSIPVPRDAIENLVSSFTEHESAIQALSRFGAVGPPTGRADESDRTIAELAQRFPIQRLVTREVLGDHNSLLLKALTPEDHDRIDRAQYEALGISLFGPIAVRILEVIGDDYDRPDNEALAQFFTTDLIDETAADRLASALNRYWDGDHDGAALVLVTQLEAVIRAIAARLGIPITKMPRGGTPGGVVGLGMLVTKLVGRLDESWRRYLNNLLADPLGVNLRNRLAHGLLDRADAADAAVLIHAACFLRSLRGSERSASSAGPQAGPN